MVDAGESRATGVKVKEEAYCYDTDDSCRYGCLCVGLGVGMDTRVTYQYSGWILEYKYRIGQYTTIMANIGVGLCTISWVLTVQIGPSQIQYTLGYPRLCIPERQNRSWQELKTPQKHANLYYFRRKCTESIFLDNY